MSVTTVSGSDSADSRKDDAVEESIMGAVLQLLVHWKLIAVCVICSWAVGIVLFFAMERQYEAVALLKPPAETNDGGVGALAGRLGGVAAMAGIDLPRSEATVDVSLATLQSRSFLSGFIVDENLWPDLYPDLWNSTTKDWAVAEQQRPTLQDAYERLTDALKIARDRQTGLVTVTLRWADRQKAAAWLSSLIAKLNLTMRAQAEEEARKNLRFLSEELDRTPIMETRQSIYRMTEMQINKAMLANVREEYAFGIIDPPVAPDADKYVSPSKMLLAFLSTLAGLLIGIALAALIRMRRSRGLSE